MSWFILWFVITMEPGHLHHQPIDVDESDHYATLEACAAEGEVVLKILQKAYPNDPAIRVYCEEFPKPTQL